MQIHELKRENKNKTKRRVGRGGRRGKTSGRGHKGQKARAGHKLRPEIRDDIKRMPKRRGYGKNRARTVNPNRMIPTTVNVSVLDAHFENGAEITPAILKEQGIVRAQKGRVPAVKILGNGTLAKKLTVLGCSYSQSAKEKIEQAGGSISNESRM